MFSKFDKAWASGLVAALVPILALMAPSSAEWFTPALQAGIATLLGTVVVFMVPNKS